MPSELAFPEKSFSFIFHADSERIPLSWASLSLCSAMYKSQLGKENLKAKKAKSLMSVLNMQGWKEICVGRKAKGHLGSHAGVPFSGGV